MDTCTLDFPHVLDPKSAKYVESKLYKGLLLLFTDSDGSINYDAVNTHYKTALRIADKASYKHSLDLDEYGQPTVSSYIRLSGLYKSRDKNLHKINIQKSIDAELNGATSYNSIISKVESFNNHHPNKNTFIAMPVQKDSGWGISIEERNTSNENKLNRIAYNNSLKDGIIHIFRNNGIEIDEDNNLLSGVEGDDLIDAIEQVLDSDPIDNNSVALNAGKFIIAVLTRDPKNVNPLVQRLQRYVDSKDGATLKELLNIDNYDPNNLNEYCAQIVALVLQSKGLENTPTIKTLGQKIVNSFKKFIAFITFDTVKRTKIKALEEADKIVGILANERLVYQTEETSPYLKTKKLLDSTTALFSQMVAELKNINEDIAKIAEARYKQLLVDTDVSDLQGYFLDLYSKDSINTLVEGMIQILEEVRFNTIPEDTSISPSLDFYKQLRTSAEGIHALTIVSKYLGDVHTVIQENKYLIGDGEFTTFSSSGEESRASIDKLLQTLVKNKESIDGTLSEATRNHVLSYLKFEYGSDYVEIADQKILKGLFKVEQVKGRKLSVDDFLGEQTFDIGMWQTYITSLANCSNTTLQIVDLSAKKFYKQAQEDTIKDRDAIIKLRERYEDLRKRGLIDSLRDLYEVKDGKLTGNLLSEYDFGTWEEEYNNFKKQCVEDFKKQYPEWLNTSDSKLGLLWDRYFRQKYIMWHKNNSDKIDTATGKLRVPKKNLYPNAAYNKLDQEVKDLLNDITLLKGIMDDRIGDNSRLMYRAPQFRGTFITTIKNKNLDPLSSKLKNITETLWRQVTVEFAKDADHSMFGSDATYNFNDPSDELFAGENYVAESVSRVPLYGINKLQDMTKLDTDIFRTLMLYSYMSNKYSSMSNISNTLELVKEHINKTTYYNKDSFMSKARRRNPILSNRYRDASRTYYRLSKYIDKVVYGNNKIIDREALWKIVFNKLANVISGLGSRLYLWGNVHGGLVNTLQGLTEIAKEGLVGEYFTISDTNYAVKEYFSQMFSSAVAWSENRLKGHRDEDLTALGKMMTRFNISDTNEVKFRNLKTSRIRPWEMFEDLMWFPYTSGDHFMQCIPFIALATKKILYTEDNKPISLWDIFKKGSLDDTLYFNSMEERDTFNKINNLIKYLHDDITYTRKISKDNMALLKELLGDRLHKSRQESIHDDKYKSRLISELSYMLERHHFNANDEGLFKTQARELANRMHGVYNHIDKGVLAQNAMGAMLMSMRNYAVGMIDRRFGSNKYSVALGRNTEGTFITFWKTLVSAFTRDEEGRFSLNTTFHAIFLPLFCGKRTKKLMEAKGYSSAQYNSMRRWHIDSLILATIHIMCGLIAKRLEGDDDDEEDEYNRYFAIAYYLLSRIEGEQAAFNSSKGAIDSFVSLTSLFPIGAQAVVDLCEITYLGIGELFYDKSALENATTDEEYEEAKKQYSKYYYTRSGYGFEKGDSKALTKIKKLTPYLRSWYIFKEPEEAATAFKFAKSTNKK